MMERQRQPHGPDGRPALPGGRTGVGLTPQKAAPRPTTWSKTFGRITTNYNTPYLHLNGWAPTRGPRGRRLVWRSPEPPRRVRAQRRPRHRNTRLRGPRRLEGGREGGGNGVRVRVGRGWRDGGAVSAGAGRTECSFPFVSFSCGLGRRGRGSPTGTAWQPVDCCG